jgi:hypothetical protein
MAPSSVSINKTECNDTDFEANNRSRALTLERVSTQLVMRPNRVMDDSLTPLCAALVV